MVRRLSRVGNIWIARARTTHLQPPQLVIIGLFGFSTHLLGRQAVGCEEDVALIVRLINGSPLLELALRQVVKTSGLRGPIRTVPVLINLAHGRVLEASRAGVLPITHLTRRLLSVLLGSVGRCSAREERRLVGQVIHWDALCLALEAAWQSSVRVRILAAVIPAHCTVFFHGADGRRLFVACHLSFDLNRLNLPLEHLLFLWGLLARCRCGHRIRSWLVWRCLFDGRPRRGWRLAAPLRFLGVLLAILVVLAIQIKQHV